MSVNTTPVFVTPPNDPPRSCGGSRTISSPRRWRARVEPRVASGWHHHGDRDVLGFLVRGRARFEFEWAEVEEGGFFHVPGGDVDFPESVNSSLARSAERARGLVHRDVNSDRTAAGVRARVRRRRSPRRERRRPVTYLRACGASGVRWPMTRSSSRARD